MTVVDTMILLSEQFTLVPFSSLVILSIIINDVRGEVEVLENQNTVWPRVYVDLALSVVPPEEMNRTSELELSGNMRLHVSSVSSGPPRHVRFSCPPEHNDTADVR